MDTSSFGFWALAACWASAIGGILVGISWARGRHNNPVDRSLLIQSLQRRMDSGELTREEYEKRLDALNGRDKP